MRCRYCGYHGLSLIEVWEDKKGGTWRRFSCMACGRKFDVAQGSGPARERATRLSRYARR